VTELARLGLSDEALKRARDLEEAMQMEDEAVERALTVKNDLEADLYRGRSALDERLADFAGDDERRVLSAKLDELEEWLYDKGEDQREQRYEAEREQLRASFAALEGRAASYPAVAATLEALDAECDRLRAAQAGTEAAAEAPVLTAVAEAEQWLLAAREKLDAASRHSAPPISPGEALAQLEDLRAVVAKEAERAAQEDATQEAAAEAEAAAAAAAAEAAAAAAAAQAAADEAADLASRGATGEDDDVPEDASAAAPEEGER